jgi:hypothetical protein
VIGLRWVAGSRSDALILHVEAFGGSEVLIGSISPHFFSDIYMDLLGNGLSKSISKRLYQHVVVVITLVVIFLAELILLETR